MTLKEILERLATARKKAGLSQSQVARLINRDPALIVGIESGHYPLSMERFLQLCGIYGVSEIWVLTGINPYFDPAGAVAAAERNNMPEAEMRDFVETLAMLKGNEPA